jgi:hypothetical protein
VAQQTKWVATRADPPPTDDPLKTARVPLPTDEEPYRLVKKPADGWMPCSPHSG